MIIFKVGDVAKIIATKRSNANKDLLNKKGIVTRFHWDRSNDPAGSESFCVLDICPGGIFTEELELSDNDWDE